MSKILSKVVLFTTFAILSVVVFTSCKNDEQPVSPIDNNSSYFDTPNGSYWTYSNEVLDTAGNSTNVSNIDTLMQVKDSVYLGQASKYMQHIFYNSLTGASNTAGYGIYENGKQVYMSSDFIKLFLPTIIQGGVDFFTEAKWFKLTDGNASSWVLDSVQITDFPIDYLNTTLTGVLKFVMSRGNSTTYAGTDVDPYTLTFEFVGNANVPSVPFISGIKVNVIFASTDFYFKAGKGLLGIYSKAMPIAIKPETPIPGLSDGISIMNTPGFKKTLLTSSVN